MCESVVGLKKLKRPNSVTYPVFRLDIINYTVRVWTGYDPSSRYAGIVLEGPFADVSLKLEDSVLEGPIELHLSVGVFVTTVFISEYLYHCRGTFGPQPSDHYGTKVLMNK